MTCGLLRQPKSVLLSDSLPNVQYTTELRASAPPPVRTLPEFTRSFSLKGPPGEKSISDSRRPALPLRRARCAPRCARCWPGGGRGALFFDFPSGLSGADAHAVFRFRWRFIGHLSSHDDGAAPMATMADARGRGRRGDAREFACRMLPWSDAPMGWRRAMGPWRVGRRTVMGTCRGR